MQNLVKKGLDWALFGVTLIYLVTGLGITRFRVIEALTFGLLGKNLAFRLHEDLLGPFLLLLGLHVFHGPVKWIYSRIAGERRSST